MTLQTKLLLGLSLAFFAFGFTDVWWGVGKPIGAILFGLFLISKVLEKETASFDQEQAAHEAAANEISGARSAQVNPDLRGVAATPSRS